MIVTWNGDRKTGTAGWLTVLFIIACWLVIAAGTVFGSAAIIWTLYQLGAWMVR